MVACQALGVVAQKG